MEDALKRIALRNFKELTFKDFVNWGFPKPDSYQMITALRFLGIISDDGKADESRLVGLRLEGESQKAAFKELVTSSYKILFENYVDNKPYNLSDSDLRNDFMRLYGVSSRVASTAVPVFKYLCERAGLIEAGTVKPKLRNKKLSELNKKNINKNKEVARPLKGQREFSFNQFSIPIMADVAELVIISDDKQIQEKIIKAIRRGGLPGLVKLEDDLEELLKKSPNADQ